LNKHLNDDLNDTLLNNNPLDSIINFVVNVSDQFSNYEYDSRASIYNISEVRLDYLKFKKKSVLLKLCGHYLFVFVHKKDAHKNGEYNNRKNEWLEKVVQRGAKQVNDKVAEFN
jgi:hypothetical protein